MLHNRDSRRDEQRLHDVLVHSGRRAQHTSADVGDVRQFEQTLNGSIFAKRPVQHREDHVHINRAITGATSESSITLERYQPTLTMHRLGRHYHGLALSQQGGTRSRVGIPRPQMCLCGADTVVRRIAQQQILRMLGRQPASFLRDTNRHHLVLVLINSVDYRRS